VAPGEHVVHEVTELVEEGDHVAVVHESARQVADQHALGQLPVEHARCQVELRGVVELALARVQVEVDPPEHLGGAVGWPRPTSYVVTSGCQVRASAWSTGV
jgi:hypothetical protein